MKQYLHLVEPGWGTHFFLREMHTSQFLFSGRVLPFEKVDIERGERAGPAVTGADPGMEGRAGPAVEEEEDHGLTTGRAGALTPAEQRVCGG